MNFRRCQARAGSLALASGSLALVAIAWLGGACGSDGTPATAPTDVVFGDTAIVAVVNPPINDGNEIALPAPGPTRQAVTLRSDDGVSATTDASGIAVLAPLTPGARTIALSGDGVAGEITVNIADGELRELAIASDAEGAAIMMEVDYKSDRTASVSPDMSVAEVNDALATSDTVVFFTGGVYEGDIDFSGSRVTLFGEGVLGGEVQLIGSVTVSGSDSRIRGAEITGDLTVPASGVGLSFTRVGGAAAIEGSDASLLSNQMCGTVDVSGSGATLVGNAGIAPLAGCP